MKEIIVKQQDVDKLVKAIEVTGDVINDCNNSLKENKKISLLKWIGIFVKNIAGVFKVAKSLPEMGSELLDLQASEYLPIEDTLISKCNFNPKNPFVKKSIAEGIKGLSGLKNCAIALINARRWEKSIN